MSINAGDVGATTTKGCYIPVQQQVINLPAKYSIFRRIFKIQAKQNLQPCLQKVLD